MWQHQWHTRMRADRTQSWFIFLQVGRPPSKMVHTFGTLEQGNTLSNFPDSMRVKIKSFDHHVFDSTNSIDLHRSPDRLCVQRLPKLFLWWMNDISSGSDNAEDTFLSSSKT
jgi:hypothetical protein